MRTRIDPAAACALGATIDNPEPAPKYQVFYF
jgi:hypothetical protein